MTYSIDQFKASISKHGGLAKSNKFKVLLPRIDEDPVAKSLNLSDLDVFCTSVNLPGKQLSTIEKSMGALNYKIPYGEVFVETNMTFLVPNDYNIRKYFVAWQKLAFDTNRLEAKYKNEYSKTIIIQQLEHSYNDWIYELTLKNAFPISIGEIQFSNDLNGYVTLQVGVSFDRYTEKFNNQGPW